MFEKRPFISWRCSTMSITISVLLISLIHNASSFRSLPIRSRQQSYEISKYCLRMTMEPNSSISERQVLEEMREEMKSNNYQSAYQILKRNPMLHLSTNDMKFFLNNLDSVINMDDTKMINNGPAFGSGPNDRMQKVVDCSNFLYRKFHRQNILRGFGCVDNKAYPEASTEISPMKLEEITGLSITALTPKQRTTYWRFGGMFLFMIEYIIGQQIGVDPLLTFIPGTFFLLGLDQLLFKGAYFESIYQTLFPEYKKKVICHEAGHFLMAYLLGLPVSNCITSAMDSRKYPEIRGQAGTIFHDSKLYDEMSKQKVTRSSLDRLSVVLMGGIAAEACMFGNAEGGVLDEQELFGLLTQVQPPWNLIRIQGQARWAAVQALLLIKEHRASFDALVTALENKLPIGDCVLAIEEHLPSTLPSLQRSDEQKRIVKNTERLALLKYVQRVTDSVGGIDTTTSSSTITSNTSHISNNEKKEEEWKDASFPYDKEGFLLNKPSSSSSSLVGKSKLTKLKSSVTSTNRVIVNNNNNNNNNPSSSSSSSSVVVVDVQQQQAEVESTPVVTVEDSEEALKEFTEIIRLLERAAALKQIELPSDNNDDDDDEVHDKKSNDNDNDSNTNKPVPGIWLKGLKSYSDAKTTTTSTIPTSPSTDYSINTGNTKINIKSSYDSGSLPKPLPDYEQKLESFVQQEQQTQSSSSSSASSSEMDTSTAATAGVAVVTEKEVEEEEVEEEEVDITPMLLLETNRGFLIKKIENEQSYNQHQIKVMSERIQALKSLATTSGTK